MRKLLPITLLCLSLLVFLSLRKGRLPIDNSERADLAAVGVDLSAIGCAPGELCFSKKGL